MDLFKIANDSDFALQPIVEPTTGVTFGFELLLRNEAPDFSIPVFFDWAFEQGVLHRVDLFLREKAFEKIVRIPFFKDMTFFYNIDNRILIDKEYEPGRTESMLENAGLLIDNICFEVSERHEIKKKNYQKIFSSYKNRSFLVAIDDYGAGYSGLKTLYNFEPDFIKIDRFLITNIFHDPKKRLFVSSLVDMAHKMGIQVIAEGVETEYELLGCEECGCDFVQGYFIQRPTPDISELRKKYDIG
jgi:EAL domain-containing protein (putative c-di-GMP-specific phosphodiesterase class I)